MKELECRRATQNPYKTHFHPQEYFLEQSEYCSQRQFEIRVLDVTMQVGFTKRAKMLALFLSIKVSRSVKFPLASFTFV